jgi:hypothetical protein
VDIVRLERVEVDHADQLVVMLRLRVMLDAAECVSCTGVSGVIHQAQCGGSAGSSWA